MRKIDISQHPDCFFGTNVTIEAERITIKGGGRIEDNVVIKAKEIYIGFDLL